MKKTALLFFLAIFITACSSNAPISPQSSNSEAKIVDGMQAITLSWGKFNYEPATMKFKLGVPARIYGDLTRLQGCFRSFEIPELGVSTVFSQRKNYVDFMPDQEGRFTFACSMGMGSGTIIVE
ncbi:MAG: cupredoxin domain-containing protein [Nanoarchaeota archaeon]